MATDFVSEVDKKFFVDNLLLNEDWDDNLGRYDDLSNYLDVESSLGSEDLLQDIHNDLEMTMLNENGLHGSLGLADTLPDLSDGSDSGLDCGLPIKEEPLSPTSSQFSDGSSDSLASFPMDTLLAPPKTECLPNVTYSDMIPGMTGNTDILALSAAALDLTTDVLDLKMPTQMETEMYTNTTSGPIVLSSPPLSPHAGSISSSCSSLSPPCGSISPPCGSNGVSHFVTMTTSPVKPTVSTSQSILSTGKTVTQVLNSKVKLQPKPVPLIKPKVGVTSPGPGKPLVLTPEEFAKLTAQGVLKFQPPIKTEPSATSPVTSPAISSLPQITMQTSGCGDVKAIKRQQRMIKNRESACLSRKRKKEYLSTIEQRLHEYNTENAKLKQENTTLRKKVNQLQTENERLKSCVSPGMSLNGTQIKKVTCLFAVLLLVSLNLGPLTNILPWQPLTAPGSNIPSDLIHHGRTLKSFNENLDDFAPQGSPSGESRSASTLEQLLRLIDLKFGDDLQENRDLMFLKDSATSFCPSYFNKTESQRLVHELTGWVMGHKEELRKKEAARLQTEEKKQKREQRKRPRKKYFASPSLRSAVPGAVGDVQYKDGSQPGQYELKVFTGAEKHYQDLLSSIHRRNDTFYVVSFRRDHLLLPATAHNKTTRPKMSLVMPAVSLNATMGNDDSFAMMQIECEVLSTRMVHVDKAVVPKQYHENATTSADPSESSDSWRRHSDPKDNW